MSPPPSIAVIFDLDDTLFPEREYAFSGFEAVAHAFTNMLGDPAVSVSRMRELFDTPRRRRVFNQLLAERGVSGDHAEQVRRMIDVYRAHRPSIHLYPDADAALTRLKGKAKLGIITDGPAMMQRAKIEALRLIGRVDHSILTDELGPGFAKPHLKAFELMADHLAVPHERCTYVADNVGKDFVAPNTLGWRTIRVARADSVYANEPPSSGGTPMRTFSSLDNLHSRSET